VLAVISDIHANLDALLAVLADVDAQGASEVICLGDVVGFGGACPRECVDLLTSRAAVCLRGDLDERLVSGDASTLAAPARRALEWEREELDRDGHGQRRRAWLAALPLRHTRGPDLFVHGSPRDPLHEYLLGLDIVSDPAVYDEVFTAFERLLFVGHTHIAGAIRGDRRLIRAAALGHRLPLAVPSIVNVGSVGRPFDRDPRACYALLADDAVTWRRVAYDVERAIARLAGTPHEDGFNPSRLRRGV
jgi:hypothetical protein